MNILEQAAKRGSEARAEYGPAAPGFTRTAQYWSVLFGIPVTAEQVVMAFVLNKITRESYAHKEDNLVDIAGYAAVLEQLRVEQKANAEFRGIVARMTDAELRAELDNFPPPRQRSILEQAIQRRFMADWQSGSIA